MCLRMSLLYFYLEAGPWGMTGRFLISMLEFWEIDPFRI